MTEDRVLALDLATRTGWAMGPDPVTYGTWDFRHWVGVGQRLNMLRRKLDRTLDGRPLYGVMFETPWISPKTHQDTARLLQSMGGVVEMFCDEHGLRCFEVVAPTWRKHFLGVGQLRVGRKGSSTDQLKRMAVERCRMLGYAVRNPDEAEALGVLDYALGYLKLGDIGLPLMSRRRA